MVVQSACWKCFSDIRNPTTRKNKYIADINNKSWKKGGYEKYGILADIHLAKLLSMKQSRLKLKAFISIKPIEAHLNCQRNKKNYHLATVTVTRHYR